MVLLQKNRKTIKEYNMGLRESLQELGANMDATFKLSGANIYTSFNEILDQAENDKTYIIKGYSVYMICYTPQKGFYAHKMATKKRQGVPLANRGYFHWADKNLAYEMIKICNEA